MRDGNYEIYRQAHNSSRVFELPMRDGNSTWYQASLARSSVFELPMRDGNSLRLSVPLVLQVRFWTSYEGWKRIFVSCLALLSCGFLNFLWGMETFLFLLRVANQDLVFELPMRDGNKPVYVSMTIKAKGFWTSYEGWKLLLFKRSSKRFYLVFELPMRDGNTNRK